MGRAFILISLARSIDPAHVHEQTAIERQSDEHYVESTIN